MKKIYLFSAMSLLACTVSCSSDDNSEGTHGVGQESIELNAAEASTMKNVQSFSFSFYKNVSSEMDEQEVSNFVVSPISAAMSMGLVVNGAVGTNRAEILKSFDLEANDIDAFNGLIGKLAKELPLILSSDSKLLFANSLWIDNSFTCKQSYVADMQSNFAADVRQLSFANSANDINAWCSQKTNGLITNLIDAGDLTSENMLLANATYFQAPWDKTFDAKDLKRTEFKNVDNTTTTTEFMQSNQAIRYYSTSKVQIFSIKYKDSNMRFLIALPNDGVSLNSAYQALRTYADNSMSEYATGNSLLLLPKFTLNSKIGLKSVYKSMGISHIFEPKNYEFTNITDNDLYVSDCSQATYFAINEKQTQAASVSDFEFLYSSTGDETAKAAVPGTIVVNRPFIYAVYDSGNTNSIVLMGRVEKIEK